MTTHDQQTDRSQLASLIADACVLRGTFTLRSGRTSSYYVDKYRFSTKPHILKQLMPMFAQRIAQIEADAGAKAVRLAGAELGGIPLVTVASLQTGLPTVFIRNAKKDYGTSKQLEGELNKDDTVIFLEDVATTGGQSIEAVNLLREQGANVLGVICTIDRLEGARENIESAGTRFESLFTTEDLGITMDA